MKKRHISSALAAAALAAGMAMPSGAAAYSHFWGPGFYGPYITNFDPAGGEHPWLAVIAGMADSVPVYELCAKAKTFAGNERTGSGCSYNTPDRRSDIAGATPLSGAYVYWGGPLGSRYIAGRADT